MTSWMTRAVMAAVTTAGLTVLAGGALGQSTTGQSDNLVATKTDWSVFTEESPKECWGVRSPKQTVNTRDRKSVV